MEMLQSCGLLSNEKTKLKKREKEERKRFVIKCDINNPLLSRCDCVPHSAMRQGCSANLPTEASAKNYASRPYKVHVCHRIEPKLMYINFHFYIMLSCIVM